MGAKYPPHPTPSPEAGVLSRLLSALRLLASHAATKKRVGIFPTQREKMNAERRSLTQYAGVSIEACATVGPNVFTLFII